MKKIYDHREFTWGLVGIALAAVCGGIMVLRGSSLKLAVIMVLMLALGWANIAQSTKRQMYKAAVPDERDRAVSQKITWRAYQLLVDGCMLAAVVLIVAYGLGRSRLVSAALLTLCLVTLASFLILRCETGQRPLTMQKTTKGRPVKPTLRFIHGSFYR